MSQLTFLQFACVILDLPFKVSRAAKYQHSVTKGLFGHCNNTCTTRIPTKPTHTPANLPFWVSLVEQTRVEMVKLSLELTERPPPPPDRLLELRLSAATLCGSLWWWRVEGNDK